MVGAQAPARPLVILQVQQSDLGMFVSQANYVKELVKKIWP
jgi:hypothetical protein